MSDDVRWHASELTADERAGSQIRRGTTVWLTGLSGSGKSTIAHRLERTLVESGRAAYCLDGDNVRHGLNRDLGFSPVDRTENVRRVGEVARLMADAGLVAIATLISPYEKDRAAVAEAHEVAGIPFHVVHVATPLAVCEARDTKGFYARARAGDLPDFTGISAPYEVPISPDLSLDTSTVSVDEAVDAIVRLLG